MSASLRGTNTHWLFKYQKEWLRCDLIAGLVTAAVVIPKAMAYATIAGLPVQVGLYTVLVPMAIYAMVGTSRPLSVSTTTTLAILAAAAFSRVAVAGDPTSLTKASAALTLLVGAILLLAALLRLGFVANFISEPVLIGFKAGIAFVIVLDQIPKLLGVHIAKGNFVHNLVATLQAVPHTSLPTLVVGIVMIVSLIGIARFFPRAPAPLIVTLLSTSNCPVVSVITPEIPVALIVSPSFASASAWRNEPRPLSLVLLTMIVVARADIVRAQARIKQIAVDLTLLTLLHRSIA